MVPRASSRISDYSGVNLGQTERNEKCDATHYSRFHIVNIGAFAFFHFWIEEHLLTVIEVDGVYVDPYTTDGISLAVGQRVSWLK